MCLLLWYEVDLLLSYVSASPVLATVFLIYVFFAVNGVVTSCVTLRVFSYYRILVSLCL